MKIWIDAGHGGKDPGAVGGGLKEKDIALSVALKVGKILKNRGLNVDYTRTTDVFLPISKREGTTRMDKANKANADIFVSIHCNSAANTSAQGLEVFSYPTSNKGTKLSEAIYNNVKSKGLYTKLRGTKKANFAVLRETRAVAALIELAFISNAEDRKLLINKQNEFAEAIANGICEYLGVKQMENKKDYQGHWAEEAIEEVKQAGIMIGFEDGNFRPNEPVSRAELATVISKMLKKN
ncbi:MAG: N-acetylmuramoyl-L-alanine amidase [Prevotellaceae bacterium]|nr:N-acetylmuramoyl-L-alanine amidase [Prevotellaceae bacterium]